MPETPFAVHALRCDYKTDPLGISTQRPRLSWQIAGDKRDSRQSAYQIQVGAQDWSPATDNPPLWDSGQLVSEQSIHVTYEGPSLRSRERYLWRVRVWDNDGDPSAWSDLAWWEMGLLEASEWRASWIDPEGDIDREAFKPCPYLRAEFSAPQIPVRQARIYATCHGLYELSLNGKLIGDQILAPGFTSYHERLQYQIYDVSDEIVVGDNAIGVILGDGWWRGKTEGLSHRNVYGERLALLLQLCLTFEDGSEQWLVSDASWKATTGPIVKSDMKDGEIYDARLELEGWDHPGFDDSGWRPVAVRDFGFDNLVTEIGPPIRRHEIFKPDLIRTPSGESVLDLGQNIAGRVRFELQAPAGTTIKLTHGETLDEAGNFTMRNHDPGRLVSTATGFEVLVQEVTYTFKGGGPERYEPRFTFQGFRYVKVEGFPGELDANGFEGVAIYSDMRPTGTFGCSNPLINQLQHNIEWSLKGNFLDIPTDCPQRERAGYTGDAQVFARTGSYIVETAPFFHKWLLDVAADQDEDGMVAIIVPFPGRHVDAGLLKRTNGSSGWADAVTIVPWTLYQVYGDEQVLADLYPHMKAWVQYIEKRARESHWSTRLKPRHWSGLPEHHAYIWDTNFHFGEWLEPGNNYAIDLVSSLIFPRPEVATAYFAYSTSLLAKTAAVLGFDEDSRRYEQMAEKVREAWVREFVSDDGRIAGDKQADYVRALAFDLLPAAQRPAAAARLAQLVRENDFHIGTGFLSTPFLCHMLSQYGYLDVAYKLLLQEKRPSWLYPVTKGATTIWEFWNAVEEDGKINMSSHNHYSPGSVGSWLYQAVAGIELGAPGYKEIVIQPQPGGDLTFAEGHFQSMYGPIVSAWRIEGGQFELEITIPPNCSAAVRLPNAAGQAIVEDDRPLQRPAREEGSQLHFDLGSGAYRFSYPWRAK